MKIKLIITFIFAHLSFIFAEEVVEDVFKANNYYLFMPFSYCESTSESNCFNTAVNLQNTLTNKTDYESVSTPTIFLFNNEKYSKLETPYLEISKNQTHEGNTDLELYINSKNQPNPYVKIACLNLKEENNLITFLQENEKSFNSLKVLKAPIPEVSDSETTVTFINYTTRPLKITLEGKSKSINTSISAQNASSNYTTLTNYKPKKLLLKVMTVDDQGKIKILKSILTSIKANKNNIITYTNKNIDSLKGGSVMIFQLP